MQTANEVQLNPEEKARPLLLFYLGTAESVAAADAQRLPGKDAQRSEFLIRTQRWNRDSGAVQALVCDEA